MARRLNKKVALIGTALFILIALAVIGVILHLSRDPLKLLQDGDIVLQDARNATSQEQKEELYAKAEHLYLKARSVSKSDEIKKEALFRLTDLFIEIEKWSGVQGCWQAIIRIDKKNIKARFGQLKFLHVMADDGAGVSVWKAIQTQVTDFLDIADQDTLSTDIEKWESYALYHDPGVATLGEYLHLLAGRANLIIASSGAVGDAEATFSQAIEYFQKLIELDQGNDDAYYYLAQAHIRLANIFKMRADQATQQQHIDTAEQTLEKAVEVARDKAKAELNMLRIRPLIYEITGLEQIEDLAKRYKALAETYSSNPQIQAAVASFNSFLGHKKLDETIEYISKAMALDADSVEYAITAANLHYKKYTIYDAPSHWQTAIDIATNALELPGAQETKGPRNWANGMRRAYLSEILAKAYIERILETQWAGKPKHPDNDEWLQKAAIAVHQVEQILGSGDDPKIIKWRAMLDLAKGNRYQAIKKLYSVYKQYQASQKRDIHLSYMLARLFENTNQTGAAAEFYGDALSLSNRSVPRKIDDYRPQSLLQCAELLIRLNNSSGTAVRLATLFEKKYWVTEKSRKIRIQAQIQLGQSDEAEQLLAEADQSSPQIISMHIELLHGKIKQLQAQVGKQQIARLENVYEPKQKETEEVAPLQELNKQAMLDELNNYRDSLAKLHFQLLEKDPNSVRADFISGICNSYIIDGKIEQAQRLADAVLKEFSENTILLSLQKILSEPDPAQISLERHLQINEQVLEAIEEPDRRVNALAGFYRQQGENEKAMELLEQAVADLLRANENDVLGDDQKEEITTQQKYAVGSLFDMAVSQQQWELAEKLAALAGTIDLDFCQGNFYFARIAIARQNYKEALDRLNEALEARPVFSHAYMLRSIANSNLGDEFAAIEDAEIANAMNPANDEIAKVLANVLYQRNLKLDKSATTEQILQARGALLKAIRQNPNEWRLVSLYADYIFDENPSEALAIRQRLQTFVPNLENTLLLGNMALEIAQKETNQKRKQALLDMAESSYIQAREIDPNNKGAVSGYARYFAYNQQPEKAEQLLIETGSKRRLWQHYLRRDMADKAYIVLKEIREAEPNNTNAVVGLLRVAERENDRQQIKEYADMLVRLRDNENTRVRQLQSYIDNGLLNEAEAKLVSFKEKYPQEKGVITLEAGLALKQGELQKALELANKALANDGDNAFAWRLRGEINRLLSNYSQAAMDLKRSKTLSDENETRIALARTYILGQSYNDAIIELKTLLNRPLAVREARLLLELVYQRLEKTNDLRELYSTAIEENPEEVLWYNKIADLEGRAGNYQKAYQMYLRSWQIGPKDNLNNIAALEGYLKVLLFTGQHDKLMEEASNYTSTPFAPMVYLKMAAVKQKTGDMKAALEYSNKAIETAGDNEDFVSNILVQIYVMLGADEVTKICQQRLQKNPQSIAANIAMYNVANMNGEYNKAVYHIDKCIAAIEPNSVTHLTYIINKTDVLIAAYEKTSDKNYLNKAVNEYKSLISKMPNNAIVLNNMAYLLAKYEHNLEEALVYAERMIELNSNHAPFLDTYAYVLYKYGNYEDALKNVQASIQRSEQSRLSVSPEVYEHLGMIREKLGQTKKALEAYRTAQEEIMSTESSAMNAIAERISGAIERLSDE